MTGFTSRQLKKLATPLERARVKTRAADGKTLSYLEGWFVVQEANRIFGYDGWDREMVASERSFVRRTGDAINCGYSARVRIRVRADGQVVLREGTGFGTASAPEPGDAHERALKAAETDATKRAFATFGGRFGLLLYRQGQDGLPGAVFRGPSPSAQMSQEELDAPFALYACDETVLTEGSPEAFCTGLRQLVEAADTASLLRALWAQNAQSLGRLRKLASLQTDRGEHYADVLERLLEARLKLIGARDAHARQTVKDISAAPSQRGRDHVPVPPYPLARLRARLGTQAGKDVTAQTTTDTVLPQAKAPDLENGERSRAAANPKGVVASQKKVVAVTTPTRRSQICGGFSVDKSALALPSERRLRSKAHLAAVSARSCLVCEDTPCHAHHITYAQPRGLSQKVSDEFTVPLCPVHHNALHLSGNESGWWRSQGIDPLPEAHRLWRVSQGGEEMPSPALATAADTAKDGAE